VDIRTAPLYDPQVSAAPKGDTLRKSLVEFWHSSPIPSIVAVALAYMVTGRLGLELAIPPGYATAIWPPSGIALAAVLVAGPSIWPGILLGALGVAILNGFDASSPIQLALSLGIPLVIATGAALQAVVGAALVRRGNAEALNFADVGDVFRLFSLGGLLASTISAGIGIIGLSMASRLPSAAIPGTFATWWAGNAIGVFVFTPLTLAWTAQPRSTWTNRWRAITVCLFTSFGLTALLATMTVTMERAKVSEDFAAISGRLASAVEGALVGIDQPTGEVAAGIFREGIREGVRIWLIGGSDVLAANSTDLPSPFVLYKGGVFGGKIKLGGEVPAPSRGHDWRLWTAPNPIFFFHHRLNNSWLVLLGGLVFTGLLGVFVMVVTGREVALRHLVESRTAMLAASEARLREYSEAVADWFWESDQELRFTSFSDSFETTLGCSPAVMLGKRQWDVADDTMEVDPAQWEAHIADLTTHRPFRDFKYWISDDSGRPKWIKTSGIPRYDSNGTFLGYRGTGTDVTGAVANAHRMHMLNRAVEQSPVSVMITDLEPRIDYVNDKFLASTGLARDEVIGCNPKTLPSMMASPEIFDEILRTLQSGQEWRGEFPNYRKNGEMFWELATVQPIQNMEGKVTNYLVIKTDITERKQTEAKMAELMEELSRSNQELEQFAYVASHDLRQPLRMVSSYVSLLERRTKGRLSEEEMEFITFARDGANRMDRMILDLLDYSRTGRNTDDFEPVALAEVFSDVLQNLELTIAESNATVEVPKDLPVVQGNYTELVRLFQNLIGNGIKYRAPETIPRIEVSCDDAEDGWVMSIKDNGIGIPPDQFDRIFGVFQRLHTRDQYEGTGIGLAVCRKVVESHGGHIKVSSEVGSGSVFAITLPHSPATSEATSV